MPTKSTTRNSRPLALHGWLDNSNSYVNLAAALGSYCWVALDLPGHGHSAHRGADAHYHMVDWVGDVMDAAEALGWSRFVLVGHSMGAAVAALVAACYPEAVDKLVLLDGLGPLSREAAQGPAHLALHRRQVSRLLARLPAAYPTLDAMVTTLCRVVPGLDRASATLLASRGSQRTERGYVNRCDRRLRATSLFALTEAQVLAFLSSIECAALLIRPTSGFAFGAEQIRTRCAAFNRLQVVEVPGHHHAHLVDAPQVAAPVAAFLRGPGAD
ncbi:MAG: alpha/beta hydrolase [Hymenobacter sp.]|nr:MAG: alpha/beta hydrolase [Hymenobacter sp.]